MTTNILVGLGAWFAAGAIVAPLVGKFIRGPHRAETSGGTDRGRGGPARPAVPRAAAQRRSAGAT